MLHIYKKSDDTEVFLKYRKEILKHLYCPISYKYTFISKLFNNILEQYKDEPLQKHIPTKGEISRMSKNPNYDLPRYVVNGYDKIVNSLKFDGYLCREFLNRLFRGEKEVVDFVKKWHPTLYVEIKKK